MTSIKLLPSQAHSINRYKSTNSKLLKCCANIYFNKQCINMNVVTHVTTRRHLVSGSPNIQKLYTKQREKHAYPSWKVTHERKIITQIRRKLITEKAMITKADKGNTVIIIYSNDYNKKVNNFITDNDFLLITNDITDKLQKEIRNAIRIH